MGLLAIVAALVLVLASACGSNEPSGTTARATATQAPAGDDALLEPFGEYEREVTKAEIRPSPGEEPPPPGTWHLTIDQGVIQVVDPGGFRFSQELTVEGDTLRIERYLGGDGVFCKDDGPSSYTWTRDGDELTLAREHDRCPDREAILGATWRGAG